MTDVVCKPVVESPDARIGVERRGHKSLRCRSEGQCNEDKDEKYLFHLLCVMFVVY